jgi:D-3-phosphoglycerate dehydrogenase
MSQPRVWAHFALQPPAQAILEAEATVVTRPISLTENWQVDAAAFDALLVGGLTPLTGEVMDRIGPRLRVIARAGIGVDKIDLEAATERGVMVVHTPDGPTESTAEHAIALILALAKLVAVTDRVLRAGKGFQPYGSLKPGLELRGATLGLVGLGRIGGRVAEIARALGMRVRAFDPFVGTDRAEALGVELAPSLGDLLASVEVVSIHCPSMPTTYHLLNAETLALMRPGSYLVNVSRGAIIDEAALVAALESGHLAGAGLDVFDPEPPAADHPLFRLPNTICTTHVGSYTAAGLLRMQVMAAQELAAALRGECPPNLANPAVWGSQRRPLFSRP